MRTNGGVREVRTLRINGKTVLDEVLDGKTVNVLHIPDESALMALLPRLTTKETENLRGVVCGERSE